MTHPFKAIVLTGASSGIGAALVTEMAGPGVHMLLTGRDASRLDSAAETAHANGAMVETAVLDVTDTDALASRLQAFDAAHPVDLVIANAGVMAGLGPGRSPEPQGTSRRLIQTNLLGAIDTVEPLLPAMLARGTGHIALVSSMAALHPHGDMPSYSASKAGLRAWGASIRQWLRPRGIAVTVICPGFVTSPMSARHQGFKPFEIDARDAARRIVRGLARGRPLITFPWPLAVLIWIGQRLPPRLSDLAAKGFRATIRPD
ncbi:MAG: SDR family NAD(P)-dependent oxidoreductase [Pseudomonadota bacterium]